MSESAQVIIDLETMSSYSHGVILSIAALFVRPSDQGKSIHDLKRNCIDIKLDAKEQLNFSSKYLPHGRHVSSDVMDWWKKQSPEARAIVRPSPDDFSAKESLELIIEKMEDLKIDVSKNSDTQYWQRGTIDFDMIANYFEMFGLGDRFSKYFDWRKVKDIRTFNWTMNLVKYGDNNKYSVPCDECVKEATDGKHSNWWRYMDEFKETHGLVAHDAVSDCLIQYEQLRMLDLL